jgi:hypothetical protein
MGLRGGEARSDRAGARRPRSSRQGQGSRWKSSQAQRSKPRFAPEPILIPYGIDAPADSGPVRWRIHVGGHTTGCTRYPPHLDRGLRFLGAGLQSLDAGLVAATCCCRKTLSRRRSRKTGADSTHGNPRRRQHHCGRVPVVSLLPPRSPASRGVADGGRRARSRSSGRARSVAVRVDDEQ